jgi:hypothetical protein
MQKWRYFEMNKVTVTKPGMILIILLLAALGLSANDYSLYLNGDGQYANCGSSTDFNFTNALTVEAWIYPTDFKEFEYMNTIAAKTIWSFEYSHGWTFRYGSANRTLNFNMGGGTGVSWIDCMAEGVLTLNAWQHVAATYDGATIRIYVNGTEVATQAFSGGVTNADEDLCLGSINNPNDMRYMTGRIDEVRIWNAARTAVEISTNMETSVANPALVAYYKMNSGSGSILTDDSGNGHTANLVGSPPWIDETSQESQAYSLQLNGSGQYANCGNSPDLNLSNALTVEAWIYPTDFKEEEHMNTIVAKTFWSNFRSKGWSFRYGSANRTQNFNMGGLAGGSWLDCRADGVLTLNTWQHVAATYDGTNIRVYVNGTQVAIEHFTSGIAYTDNDLCIGSVNYGDQNYMTGLIDEVRIWNVVRSINEINFNMGQCEVTGNLVAYYRMTDGSGTTLTDNSGHGHTATLVGNPDWSNNTFCIPPVVSTGSIDIGITSATANGTIVSLGSNGIIQHGHCWIEGIGILPTVNDSRTLLGPASSIGAFCSSLTDLTTVRYYTVRSYVSYMDVEETRTSYGNPVEFMTAGPLPMPGYNRAKDITTSGFTVLWLFDIRTYSYDFLLDVSTDPNFSSFAGGYHDFTCGTYTCSLTSNFLTYEVTGLEASTWYYYRLRSYYDGSYSYYTGTIVFRTLSNYNVSYNTGNITGVRIYTAETDYGIDPPSPLVFTQGYSGTIQAVKDGYTWSLADGSDSNVLSDLSSNKSISFIGTYSYEDPAYPGFSYAADPDIQISVSSALLEDLTVPLPHNTPGEAIVLNFSGTAESDITITVPEGIWYIVAYYNDPSDGGLAWHQASPHPADGPQSLVFSNLPFAAKSDIPVIIGSEDATLAVELSAFTAVASANSYVTLSWVTQSEANLLGFTVLRNTTSILSEASGISALIPAVNSSQTTIYSFRDMDLASEDCYYYWLQIVDMDGSLSYYGPICIATSGPGYDDSPAIPLVTRLLPCYPNPFNPSTTIHYELKSPERVEISVYSSKGELVDTYKQDHSTAGAYSWIFQGVDRSGRALSSGVYFYTMTAGKQRFINKMVLLK